MSTFLHQIIEQLHDQPKNDDNTEDSIVTDEPEEQLFVLKTE